MQSSNSAATKFPSNPCGKAIANCRTLVFKQRQILCIPTHCALKAKLSTLQQDGSYSVHKMALKDAMRQTDGTAEHCSQSFTPIFLLPRIPCNDVDHIFSKNAITFASSAFSLARACTLTRQSVRRHAIEPCSRSHTFSFWYGGISLLTLC